MTAGQKTRRLPNAVAYSGPRRSTGRCTRCFGEPAGSALVYSDAPAPIATLPLIGLKSRDAGATNPAAPLAACALLMLRRASGQGAWVLCQQRITRLRMVCCGHTAALPGVV